MDIQFDFKKITASKGRIISTIGNFWQRIYKYILALFLAVSIFLGVYVWQRSLSGGQWSEEKKQEYLNAESGGIVFNESDFNKVSSDLILRNQKTIPEQNSMRDIFK